MFRKIHWVEIVKGLPVALMLLVAAAFDVAFFEAIYASTFPVDRWWPGLPVDFKNTWFGAWTYWNGHLSVLFDQYEYNVARWPIFGPEVGHIWSYPLHFLMLMLPLGLLSFPVAATLWTVVNLAVFVVFLRRTTRPSLPVWLAILVSSGFLYTLFFGQITVIAIVLLIGGLAVLPRRPLLAGIAFGVLTVKPHFGVLLALHLLLDRRWSTIAAAVVTACVLIGLSVLVFSADAWMSFLHDGLPQQTEAMMEKRKLWPWMPSWYGSLRLMLWSREAALIAQAGVAALCCGVLVLWKLIGVSTEERARLLPLLTLTALPYVLPSDMLLVAPLLAQRLVAPGLPYPIRLVMWMLQVGACVFFAVGGTLFWPAYALCLSITTGWLVLEITLRQVKARAAARTGGQPSFAAAAPV